MLSFLHHQRCSWLRLTSECVGVGACVCVFGSIGMYYSDDIILKRQVVTVQWLITQHLYFCPSGILVRVMNMFNSVTVQSVTIILMFEVYSIYTSSFARYARFATFRHRRI